MGNDGSFTVTVMVKPNARQPGIRVAGDVVEARVNAPAVDGRANERLVEMLAEHYHVPRSRITILHGTAGRRKLVQVSP